MRDYKPPEPPLNILPCIGYLIATAALIYFCWKWSRLLCAPYC